MSSTLNKPHAPTLPVERKSGTLGMILFITTEAALFVVLFFSYFYLASQSNVWPLAENPRLVLSTPMTILLVASSFVLHWGERSLRREARGRAIGLVLLTILLGAGFLVIQGFEYHHHLKSLTPGTNAYGSIFYTITGIHALHLFTGICMLIFALLPRPGDRPALPETTLHNAGLYWHFVDVVWLFIFSIMYIAPRIQL